MRHPFDMTGDSPVQKQRMSGLKRAAFLALVLVFAVSVVLRVSFVDTTRARPSSPPSGASSLTTGAMSEHARQASFLESTLPAVTEASLFGLIGFALGFTTRKAFKLALILIALGFVTIQVLVAMGKIQVDWSEVIHAIDRWVLNFEFDTTLPAFLKQRVPTLAVFLCGYVLGFRKG